MLGSLAGKTAIVTGGASGIGAAICRLFAQQGARVVIADVNRAGGETLANELAGSAIYSHCDVTQEEEVMQMVLDTVKQFGRLDVMCNNVGIGGKQGRAGLIENLVEEDLNHILKLNLTTALLGMKHAARAMRARHTRGCIINTTSIGGLRANMTNAGAPIYHSAGYLASKSALEGVTKLAACENAPYGIRVNAVAPGVTATPVVGRFLTGKTDPTPEETAQALEENSVLQGVALMPEDVAKAHLYLASDLGRCVNGHTLVVDLGVTIGVSGELTLVPGTLT